MALPLHSPCVISYALLISLTVPPRVVIWIFHWISLHCFIQGFPAGSLPGRSLGYAIPWIRATAVQISLKSPEGMCSLTTRPTLEICGRLLCTVVLTFSHQHHPGQHLPLPHTVSTLANCQRLCLQATWGSSKKFKARTVSVCHVWDLLSEKLCCRTITCLSHSGSDNSNVIVIFCKTV